MAASCAEARTLGAGGIRADDTGASAVWRAGLEPGCRAFVAVDFRPGSGVCEPVAGWAACRIVSESLCARLPMP